MRKFLYTIIALAATLLTTSCLYGLGSDDGLEIEDTSGFKVEVSSKEIREKIKTGKDFKNLLPKAVFDYIIKGDLYTR